MNGSAVIDGLQLLSAALWVVVLLVRAPACWRVVTGRPAHLIDFYAAALFGNGAVQNGFVLRWWLYPNAKTLMQPGELTLWGCLYVASALIALATLRLPRHG